ncbi:MAG: hypothetical protein M1825_004883 [Sarcosagium campestre]|nr:MAG: hypothetical protein M1825_004883 [Sarcosagium campestre]
MSTLSLADKRLTRILAVDPAKLGTFSFLERATSPLEDWHLTLRRDTQDATNLKEAAELLRTSVIPVAFPTETVYGLGADATRSAAVQGIYKAKQRPLDNPLIVHVCSLRQLRGLLQPVVGKDDPINGQPNGQAVSNGSHVNGDVPSDTIPSIYHDLIQRFWPGPLTILLRNPTPSALAPEVTAGLPTFGARMPKNLFALALIKTANVPLAAPSANASTKPSPTTAQHVQHDLDGRIQVILDGGSCDVGVESTVVDGLCVPPAILRPGGVTLEQLRQCKGWEDVVIGYKDSAQLESKPKAPGMKYKHYSPSATVILHEAGSSLPSLQDVRARASNGESIGVIRTRHWLPGLGLSPAISSAVGDTASSTTMRTVEIGDDPGMIVMHDIYIGPGAAAIARGLFSALREFDLRGVAAIFVEGIGPTDGVQCAESNIHHPHNTDDGAAAVMNRLRKAAAVRVV